MAMIGCEKPTDKDTNPTDKDPIFTDYNKDKLNQTIFADETANGSGFAFTAKENWDITIGDAKKSTTDNSWVEVSPMNGGAGSQTITIKLDLNYSGKDRSSKININSGESTITITVEQKGTTSEGSTQVKVVSSITLIDDIGIEGRLGYKYNEDYNVSEITSLFGVFVTVAYSESEISMTMKIESSPEVSKIESSSDVSKIALNSEGNAISCEGWVLNGRNANWSYSDGYVSAEKVVETIRDRNETEYKSQRNNSFQWAEGNLTGVTTTIVDEAHGNSSKKTTKATSKITYNTYKNNSNFNFGYFYGDSYVLEYSFIESIGCFQFPNFGKKSINLIDKINTTYYEGYYGEDDKNKIVSEKETRQEYELNAEGDIARVKIYISSITYTPDGKITVDYKDKYMGDILITYEVLK